MTSWLPRPRAVAVEIGLPDVVVDQSMNKDRAPNVAGQQRRPRSAFSTCTGRRQADGLQMVRSAAMSRRSWAISLIG